MRLYSATLMCVSLTALMLTTAVYGQFRLNKFSSGDPVKAATILADGSSVFALQYADTALIWKSDAQGQMDWVSRIADPGTQTHLLETSNASITRVDAYAPLTMNGPTVVDDSVVQRVRLTRLSASGSLLWSSTVAMYFLQPYEFWANTVESACVATSDGGTITALLTTTNGIGPSSMHVLKHSINGDLLWCMKYGDAGAVYYTWSGSSMVPPDPEVFLVATDDGGAYLMDQNRVHSVDGTIIRISNTGEPLQHVRFKYLGTNQYPDFKSFGQDAQGNPLLGYNITNGTISSVVLYRFNASLSLIDKDIIHGDGLPSSINAIYPRADGHVMLHITAPGFAAGTSTWVEINSSGEVQSAHMAPALPYINDQTLKLYHKGARYFDNGVAIAHSHLISHPILGNVGFFAGQALLEPGGTSCYFEPTTAADIQVPDSLVSILDEPLPGSIPGDFTVENIDPLSAANPITTLPGCLVQVGIEEATAAVRFTLAPNPVQQGDQIRLTVDEPMRMSIVDMTGRSVTESFSLPSAGTWAAPFPAPLPGTYLVHAFSPSSGRTVTNKLVVY